VVGILVHGNNHFILSGPAPTDASALAIARHFSLIQIGDPVSLAFEKWQIRDKDFRENLEWAVIVKGDRDISPGAAQLLEELSARGVTIQDCRGSCW
jgi:hypothetical protein